MSAAKNWNTVSESPYPWERDALDFVRQRFPAHEPYRAWSNFEFIADDGSINEVDLLVFAPEGLFLVEIKSRPGRLYGDAGTWSWETEGRKVTTDNPLIATNQKAKKLNTLLQRQRAFRKKGRVPFIEALVFCSAPELQCELTGNAAIRVCFRDQEEKPDRPGIMATLKRRACPGLSPQPRGKHDRPTAKLVSQAMEQAGIRSSRRRRTVGDWVLRELIAEGPGFQDWEAKHTRLETTRRIRLYLVRLEASEDDRRMIERAANREAQLVERLDHAGVLRLHDFTDHELGPALVFEHDPNLVRLDHYLTKYADRLTLDVRLELLRQIAEAVRYAHEKKVVHRALAPTSVLVGDAPDKAPSVRVFNWQAGYRGGDTSAVITHQVSATSHVEQLVEDVSTAYMAPEALWETDNTGEHLDVFSLGALAYHILAGKPPAANGVELSEHLRVTKGLQISAVLNGAGDALQDLIRYSTHPEVPSRLDSAAEFLEYLDLVEDELSSPDQDVVEDPARAQQGDRLAGGFSVLKRFGRGSCAVALLVEREGEEYVLKVANDPEQNDRLRDEAEVLEKLRHHYIVEYCTTVEVGDRVGILMRRAGNETLGQRLRKEGQLHLELLQRFGEDLLDAVRFLEDQGIAHRDIKPDNIGVGPVGRGDKLHLILFDFSLSRTAPDNINVGTAGYVDPMLRLRKPPRWDLHAERYAAAVTLYELATGPGNFPVWGDGESDPSHLTCEATIEADLLDPSIRENLARFFEKAFRRDPARRFDNAEEMLREWRRCFEALDATDAETDHATQADQQARIENATFDTRIAELGLGGRAANALDRANILTVRDLLTRPVRRLQRMRGVGNKTRRDISTAAKTLRKRLGQPPSTTPQPPAPSDEEPTSDDVAACSVDRLAALVLNTGTKPQQDPVLQALLGQDPDLDIPWPSQSDVARHLNRTPVAVHQALKNALPRWKRAPVITRLRDDLVEIVASFGGVCAAQELPEPILLARGSMADEPARTRQATAIVRAAVEVERTRAEPRLLVQRYRNRVLIASDQELANYASRLGSHADRLADEDPLAAPQRALERLRTVKPVALGEDFSDTRLIRLAAAASQHAALSSRQELYPRGMAAERALRLSYAALLGGRERTVEQIHQRVRSRYPEAEALPDRPALDDLLSKCDIDLKWDPNASAGRGAYVSPLQEALTVTTGSGTAPRYPTRSTPADDYLLTPEDAEARQFEERLYRADREGAFLALLVPPREDYYDQARREIEHRFRVELIDFEQHFIDALRAEADKARVNWDLVLQTDARPGDADWDKLLLLVRRAMAKVEKQMSAVTDRTLLLIYPCMLARYDQMDFLERMRDRIGRRDGIHGLWLLIPNDTRATMNGRPVPVISAGQRARVPEPWIKNVHRANGHTAVSQ